MNKNTPDLLGIKKQARDSHTGSREGREDYNPPPTEYIEGCVRQTWS